MARYLFDPRIQASCFLVWCLVWALLALFSVQSWIPKLGLSDTQLHFFAYMMMSFFAIAFCTHGRQLFMWAVVTAAGGLFMECAQLLTPDRTFQIDDLIANTTGAGCGYLIAVGALFILLRPLRRAFA